MVENSFFHFSLGFPLVFSYFHHNMISRFVLFDVIIMKTININTVRQIAGVSEIT